MKRRKIIPYNPKLKEYARQLRNHSTKSEILLWQKLKRKQMYGYYFHRQKPIDNYILDFFCYELMVGIEVDGYSHQLLEVQRKDTIKERKMNELGITVLRFTDQQVFKDMFNVLLAIEYYIQDYEENGSSLKEMLVNQYVNTPKYF
ncbi:endonuclease domain-containing protein [Aquimarina sp. ERC-38]|uniref:endonuclease domain-containing protein n=1 Tax=Aquimarina sp. ERC-38 TaxID=2949996 RepID=UPI002246333A|nr:endonuclease domain-containing protein [Aquimarina sp. ERC-38]UZO80461.1 endonuclease domain-containing protein [Aquimarina sp. ERC-38]